MTKLDELYEGALKASRSEKPRRAKSYGGKVASELPGSGKRYYVVVNFNGKTVEAIAQGLW